MRLDQRVLKTPPGAIATRTGARFNVAENDVGSLDVLTQIVCVAPVANCTSTGTSAEKSSSTPVCVTVPVNLVPAATCFTEYCSFNAGMPVA